MSKQGEFEPIVDPRPRDAAWPVMKWPPEATVLSGAVVELRPYEPKRDAGELFDLLNFDAVWQHMAGRPQDAEDYAASLSKRIEEGRFVWIVRTRQPYRGFPPQAIIGTSSYLDASTADARLEIGSTAYAPAVWATAVNPESKLLLLAHAFDVLGAGRVQLKTDIRNHRSQKAIARLGAKYEGTLRRFQRREDGTIRDTVLFSVAAEDWSHVREGLRKRIDHIGPDGSSRARP
jgi:RimJ/RimL family protein N-acetyltransferase